MNMGCSVSKVNSIQLFSPLLNSSWGFSLEVEDAMYQRTQSDFHEIFAEVTSCMQHRSGFYSHTAMQIKCVGNKNWNNACI